jgi:hypothetical protein
MHAVELCGQSERFRQVRGISEICGELLKRRTFRAPWVRARAWEAVIKQRLNRGDPDDRNQVLRSSQSERSFRDLKSRRDSLSSSTFESSRFRMLFS